jgi:hypothetical protein
VPRVDYEQAWDELQQFLLRRDGWGTKTVITEMADIRLRCMSDEDSTSEAPASGDVGAGPVRAAPDPDQSKDQEVRDGSQHDRNDGVRPRECAA